MDAMTASKERARLWRELKPLLIRSLGREGAADWMDFAGKQLRIEAERIEANVIDLKPAGW
jgi:hypothetical protein